MLSYAFQPSGEMALGDWEDPRPEPGDAVVEVLSAGICGTDLKIARGEHRLFPAGTRRVPGHELVGQVVVPQSGLGVGDIVAVAPNIACGECPACRRARGNLCDRYASIGLTLDGGFAERVRVPATAVAQGNVIPLPATADPDLAVLMEPVAAVLRGVEAAGLGKGNTLAVLGAGPIGLIAVLLARQLDVETIIVSQPSAHRRALAAEFGADVLVDPIASDVVEEVRRATDGQGADVVMVTTPVREVFGRSLEMAAAGGRVNFFAGMPSGRSGIEIDANLIHYRELIITGTTANTTDDCRRALDMILADPAPFAALVTHHHPLREADRAFADAASGRALKVVIHP